MEPQQPRKAARFKWSEKELQFIQDWYGRIPIDELARILDKSKRQIYHACFKRKIKAGERIQETLTIRYNRKTFEVTFTPYRYITTFNADGSRKCVDTQRATKAHKVLAKKTRKRIAKPEPVPVQIKPFEPQGKVLVKIDNKTWAYR